MAGLVKTEPTPNDAAYAVLIGLTILSAYALPVLLCAYALVVFRRNAPQKTSARLDADDGPPKE